ncbi:MAG: hypothetical protein BGO09_04315 [Bacteroidetes bacterium 47-18]|nr:MAG: hypothetical protein BGO09_04315 [Bacteroidetes bacterium 47-18]
MKSNIGTTDKIVRIVAALLIGVLYFSGIISGTLALVSAGVAVIFLLTAFISFCPLYMPFGINTSKKKKK